jgi:hypothetical protein
MDRVINMWSDVICPSPKTICLARLFTQGADISRPEVIIPIAEDHGDSAAWPGQRAIVGMMRPEDLVVRLRDQARASGEVSGVQ